MGGLELWTPCEQRGPRASLVCCATDPDGEVPVGGRPASAVYNSNSKTSLSVTHLPFTVGRRLVGCCACVLPLQKDRTERYTTTACVPVSVRKCLSVIVS